jgi:hypothetical protein
LYIIGSENCKGIEATGKGVLSKNEQGVLSIKLKGKGKGI